jgi:hypothetical protein
LTMKIQATNCTKQLMQSILLLGLLYFLPYAETNSQDRNPSKRQTAVTIAGDEFQIKGKPTYSGRVWHGHKIQGLLLNSRMVQGIFDDRNPDTAKRWAYPDTGRWDAERNTREFLAAMPVWRSHGLLAFTLNLQGGSPEGYSKEQPWHNSAIEADGTLRADCMNRLERILDRADELGMVGSRRRQYQRLDPGPRLPSCPGGGEQRMQREI